MSKLIRVERVTLARAPASLGYGVSMVPGGPRVWVPSKKGQAVAAWKGRKLVDLWQPGGGLSAAAFVSSVQDWAQLGYEIRWPKNLPDEVKLWL